MSWEGIKRLAREVRENVRMTSQEIGSLQEAKAALMSAQPRLSYTYLLRMKRHYILTREAEG